MARAFHNSFGVITRRFYISVPRCCCCGCLLHIDEAQTATASFFAFHCEQHGEAETPKASCSLSSNTRHRAPRPQHHRPAIEVLSPACAAAPSQKGHRWRRAPRRIMARTSCRGEWPVSHPRCAPAPTVSKTGWSLPAGRRARILADVRSDRFRTRRHRRPRRSPPSSVRAFGPSLRQASQIPCCHREG